MTYLRVSRATEETGVFFIDFTGTVENRFANTPNHATIVRSLGRLHSN